jgi:hypothetical protein
MIPTTIPVTTATAASRDSATVTRRPPRRGAEGGGEPPPVGPDGRGGIVGRGLDGGAGRRAEGVVFEGGFAGWVGASRSSWASADSA